MPRVLQLLLAGGLVVAAACGDKAEPPAGPVAGDLVLSYTSPGPQDGALLILVTGGSVQSVTPVGSHRVESAVVGGSATRFVVTGDLAAGDLVRLRVPDVARVADYAATVEAAADRNTFALSDPGSYATAIRR